MRIDIHTHTFPAPIAPRTIEKLSSLSHSHPFTDGSDAALLSSMQRAGIDYSVRMPVATAPSQVTKINDALITDALALHAKAPQLSGGAIAPALLTFAAIHPDFDDPARELARVAAAGIKGVKVHSPYQDCALDDPKMIRVLRAAKENRLIVLAHMGYDIGLPKAHNCTPYMLRNALEQVPGLTVIAAHMGGWREWEDVVPALAKVPDVFLDTSFSHGKITPKQGDPFYETHDTAMLSDTEFTAMVRAFGAKRILFGSDSPWSDQSASINAINALPLTDSEKALILGENAAKLLF